MQIPLWVEGRSNCSVFHDELTKIVFYPSVHSFCLSIGTRVKGSTDILLYACCLAYCFGKVTCKSGISVGDDALGNSKPREEMLKIELCYTLAIYGLIAR